MLRPLHYTPFTARELKPAGWLKKQLEIQAAGLSGHLDQVWPDIRDSRWIGGDKDGWERVPYWLDGFVPLAWLLEDEGPDRPGQALHRQPFWPSQQRGRLALPLPAWRSGPPTTCGRGILLCQGAGRVCEERCAETGGWRRRVYRAPATTSMGTHIAGPTRLHRLGRRPRWFETPDSPVLAV